MNYIYCAVKNGLSMKELKEWIPLKWISQKEGRWYYHQACQAVEDFLNILITLVGAGIAYYIMLPPMNFNVNRYVYFFVIVALIYVAAAAITSGALA